MTTSHGGRNGWETGEPSAADETSAVGEREHYATGLVGLFTTLAVLAIVYPSLRATVAPLQTLSSTAIVAFAVVVWATAWFALELAWTARLD